eukprot:Nitzschia sp. Nitz4//scaffold128_size63911//26542//27252//NITZ4_006218-RA/size63911-processed-gene-0.112-mRNA-1//1//CDS//3329534829//3581//frame0
MTTPDYVSNPEKWLEDLTKGNDFVAVVIFRGSWCKYDKHYLQRLGKFHQETMSKEGLILVAWTSEGPGGAKKADEEWGLTKDYGFSFVIGDDTNALAEYLVDDCLLPKLITMTPAQAKVSDYVTEGTYPNGLVQPGMVWYAHHGSMVLRWASTAEPPSYGATTRPMPNDIWESVLKRKHELDKGDAVMPVNANNLRQCTNDFDVNCSMM